MSSSVKIVIITILNYIYIYEDNFIEGNIS